MMSERRALLDPEMYKISEEDSQDEEVLASYTEDALKLGIAGAGDDVSNGNIALGVSRHSRFSWNSGGGRYSRHDDSLAAWEYSGDLSTSQFNPSKLRIVHGLSSGRHGNHYQQHSKSSGAGSSTSSTTIRIVTNNATNGEEQDNSVDWPETSTNSDSCLSGDELARRGDTDLSRKGHTPSHTTTTRFHGVNSNKFLGRTYFGDHLQSNHNTNEEDEVVASSTAGSYHCSSTNSRRAPNSRPQPEFQNRSKQFQKRPRRRSARNARENDVSTSGSDCSDIHDDDDGSSSGSGSSSSCTDCLNSTGATGRRASHRHHHSHRRNASSSEVEEYDSSYSESSYGDEGEDDEEYDDYYDDDNEANECFDDIVKFLSDGEVEQSTNSDGDLFLVEYSGDESEERIAYSGLTSVTLPDSHVEQQTLSANAPHSSNRVPEDDGTESIASTPSQDSGRRNSAEGVNIKPENDSSASSAPTNTQKYQKSSSGKGAKGKISRLLKRKGKEPTSKTLPESSPTAPPSSNSSLVTTPETPSPKLQSSTAITNVIASSTTSTPSPANPPTQSGSTRKQKGSAISSSTAGAPEKVFRFKDEHGGETRTVFVDIPQSARTGNLLGRRATLIESILGVIPGHFSTPPSLDRHQHVVGNSNDRIMVAGFVPDSIASKYRRIKIGDWLQSVDDIPVDHGNVDQVLNSRSMYGKRRTAFETEYLRLKLTLRRVAGCMVSLPPSSSSVQDDTSLEANSLKNFTTSITEPCWSSVSPQVQSNVAILFISNGSSSTNSAIDEEASAQGESSSSQAAKEKSKDIVYSWPPESESKMVKALAASQGMFSTLYRLLWDVTGSHPVVSKVVIDDCEMDITYTSDDQGKSLLLIGIASSLSTFTMHHHNHNDQQQKGKSDKGTGSVGTSGAATNSGETKKKEKKIRWREPQTGGVTVSTRVLARVDNLLKYQFGSFARAFKIGNEDKVNRLITNALAALNDLSEDFVFLQVPGNFLRFPNCIRSGIDDILYSFETSDTLKNGRGSISSRGNSSTSSRRRSKDSYGLPVYHCHGSCLMYKGVLITSHLENDLASAFHGWWRTQLGLWEGIKRNALLEKWKPVSRLALWQETCISKKGFMKPPINPVDISDNLEPGEENVEEHENGLSRSSVGTHKLVRCFSGLVGIGNFTLGFVLEHLTDYRGAVGPDADWLRRAMATLCRLYQSGLSRSFECWLDDRNGGREEYVELCGTSSASSSNKHVLSLQEKLGSSPGSSRGAMGSTKKTPATGSILKNTESNAASTYGCPVHSHQSGPSVMITSMNSGACTCSQQVSSSPMLKGFMMSGSSTSSSSSSTFGGGSGIRSGITRGMMISSSMDDFSSMPRPGNGDTAAGFDSEEEMDADDTTTGTGSDSSSFKWYERAASEPIDASTGRGCDVKHIRVTRGNVLLDYMQVEFGRGVMLSTKDIHEGWAAAIRHNFRQSATVIHHILHKAANARQRLEERGNDKKWVSLALAPISEHGILFNCQVTDPRDVHKKKPRKREVNYWVVGRIYPDEREIYVCYEDGPLSQNLVEIAYKIALNVHC